MFVEAVDEFLILQVSKDTIKQFFLWGSGALIN